MLACCLASTALATDLIEVRVRTSANKEVGVLVYLDELARTHRESSLRSLPARNTSADRLFFAI